MNGSLATALSSVVNAAVVESLTLNLIPEHWSSLLIYFAIYEWRGRKICVFLRKSYIQLDLSLVDEYLTLGRTFPESGNAGDERPAPTRFIAVVPNFTVFF